MIWQKKGLIFETTADYAWNKTHAQLPVVDILNNKAWRIYYAARNSKNQSDISFIEVEAGNPSNIIYKHTEPLLRLGELGTFDDSGIMPSCIVNHQDKKYLYYTGWNHEATIGYRLAIGLAISHDGVLFEKYSEGPVLDRSVFDHCLCASPFVRIENDTWKMWYVSGTHWKMMNEKPEPFYHIKYATSLDGISWKRDGTVCIDYDNFTDAVSRPCVIKTDTGYLMFYSFRNNKDYRNNPSNSYRIGFAASPDGIVWEKKDSEAGIAVSETGWDSEMIAYPYVINFKDKAYMFYNGNGFGRTGIGYAEWK
jgi:hypothetical protein